MKCLLLSCLVLSAFTVEAGASDKPVPESSVPCSVAWYRFVDARVPTGDGQGHGPDFGSDEWKSVVEMKLGLRGQPDLPARGSDAWCHRIDVAVRAIHPTLTAQNGGPAFDCSKIGDGSIEPLICSDAELSALDRKLASVYAAAAPKAHNEHPPVLRAEQSGWIKGRNDCWKSDDQRSCVRDEYVRRIAELQARYRLVKFTGPVRFQCSTNAADELSVTYFETEPRTLIAERGDSVSLMYLQPGEHGARYQGRNESLQEGQSEARIIWGYGAPELRCKKTP